MTINLINSDLNLPGIYRAILFPENKVYVPALMKLNFDINNILNDMSLFETYKNSFFTALWCAPNISYTNYTAPISCWVTFEAGDGKRPIILGFQGNSINSSGNISISNNSNINNVNSSPTFNIVNNDINSNTSDVQLEVVRIAQSFKGEGKSSKSGYCQAWVADVIKLATGKRLSMSSAKLAGETWGISNDLSNIPLGATIWALYNPNGHAAIYIGNNKVANNRGNNSPYIDTLDYYKRWASKKSGYKGMVWGWNGNINLSTFKK